MSTQPNLNQQDAQHNPSAGGTSPEQNVPPTPKSWEDEAREMQQEFYDRLGGADWCSYSASELEYLHRNIGFALFGPPNEEPKEQNLNTGYTEAQRKEILSICETIQNKDNHVYSIAKNLFNRIGSLIFDYATGGHLTYSESHKNHINKIIQLLVHKQKGPESLDQLVLNALASRNIRTNKESPHHSVKDICDKIEILVAMEMNVTWLSVIFVILRGEAKIPATPTPANPTPVPTTPAPTTPESSKSSTPTSSTAASVIFPVTEAVFRVPLESSNGVESHIFIDRNRRVYESWDKFLKDNKLPNCTYCYPTAGVYSGDELGNVKVEYGQTPAGSTANKVVEVVDKVGIGASIASTVVFGAAILTIPVAVPLMVGAAVVGGAVGVWGIGRGVENLVDRGLHEQSINVTDPEARNAWISIGVSSLGLAAAGATQALSVLTRSGMVIGETGQLIVNVTQISAITASGVGIINGAIILHERYVSKSLTPLDIFQFSSSILFFSSSVANFKMANTIIKDVQATVLEDYRSSLRSNRHRKAFDKVARNTRGGDSGVDGNAKVIRGIKNINSPDDFFSGVVRLNKHHKGAAANMAIGEHGNVKINEQMTVNPSKFADMPKADRIKLLTASKQFNDGTLNKAKFDVIIKDIYKPQVPDTSTPHGTAETPAGNNIVKASNSAELDVRPFSFLSKHDLRILTNLGQKFLGPLILPLAKELFSKLFGYQNERFVQFMEFSYRYILAMVYDMEDAYQSALLVAKYYANFDQTSFDRTYGIQGDRFEHFIKCVRSLMAVAKKLEELREKYMEYRQCQSTTSDTSDAEYRDSFTYDNVPSTFDLQRPSTDLEPSPDLTETVQEPQSSTDILSPQVVYSETTLVTSTPPRSSNLRLLRPTSTSYAWEFSVNGEPSDEDILIITANLSDLHVDRSVVDVRRYANRIVVNFLEREITVTVKMDKVNGTIAANIRYE